LLVQEGLGRPQDSAVVLQIPTQTATFPPTLTPLQPEPTSAPTETLPDVPVATATIELPAPVEIATPTQTPVPTKTKKVVMPPPGVGPGERWIDIDLSKQKTYAYQGGELVNIFRVSTGTWQHPTVTGIFRIYIKYRSQTMYGEDYYLPNVPYVMYFYEDYGLHGTYWHNNFGTPMSHGCINLKTGDAGWLYDWASVGTVVNVHP
jgi:lipoprotein-anchoring transpeptidase ErfK/SrfK